MLMSAGIALLIGVGIIAFFMTAYCVYRAIAEAAAYQLESSRLYDEKRARRARYERLAGLNS